MIPAEAVAKVWPFLRDRLERKMEREWSVQMEATPVGLGIQAEVRFRHAVVFRGVSADEVLSLPPIGGMKCD